jgi:phospholipid/cholesterol/gamma-HCH transport system substrate-binding protein
VISSHLKVGIFVSTGIALFIVITIWLSGRQSGEPTLNYSMYFYSDVSGLMLGGPVFYLGVEVGNVTRMEIIPGDPMSIRIDIEVQESTPVDTGTSASLAFKGITGVAVINLFGDPGMNLPLKAPPGQDYPVIEVRDMGLAAVLSGAPQLMEKANILLDKAGSLLGTENQDSISSTLANVESLTGALRDKEQAFAQLPEDLTATLKDIQLTLAELKEVAADVRPSLVDTMQNVEDVSERLSSLVTRLDAWADENSSGVNDFLNNGLGQVPDLVSDTRDALREMEKLLKELREDPSSLVYKSSDDAVEVEQ